MMVFRVGLGWAAGRRRATAESLVLCPPCDGWAKCRPCGLAVDTIRQFIAAPVYRGGHVHETIAARAPTPCRRANGWGTPSIRARWPAHDHRAHARRCSPRAGRSRHPPGGPERARPEQRGTWRRWPRSTARTLPSEGAVVKPARRPATGASHGLRPPLASPRPEEPGLPAAVPTAASGHGVLFETSSDRMFLAETAVKGPCEHLFA
jgi:hypothetical protein